MPNGPAPTCECIGAFPPAMVLQWIYCQLITLNAAVAAGGGAGPNGTYTPFFDNVTADGSIPAGVSSSSITAVSGTVTVQGQALPNGSTVGFGGDGGVSDSAILYTVSGVALIAYNTPS